MVNKPAPTKHSGDEADDNSHQKHTPNIKNFHAGDFFVNHWFGVLLLVVWALLMSPLVTFPGGNPRQLWWVCAGVCLAAVYLICCAFGWQISKMNAHRITPTTKSVSVGDAGISTRPMLHIQNIFLQNPEHAQLPYFTFEVINAGPVPAYDVEILASVGQFRYPLKGDFAYPKVVHLNGNAIVVPQMVVRATIKLTNAVFDNLIEEALEESGRKIVLAVTLLYRSSGDLCCKHRFLLHAGGSQMLAGKNGNTYSSWQYDDKFNDLTPECE